MPEQTKMAAYAVSLSFVDGPMLVNTTIAPSPEAAVAIVTAGAIQQLQITQPLAGVVVAQLTPEWLDLAVRATKGMLPEGGNAQVLQLVPQEAGQQAINPGQQNQLSQRVDAVAEWRKRHCPWLSLDAPEPA